jgi:ribosomal protein L29
MDAMTRSPDPRPTKDELRDMTVEQLNVYIGHLRSELGWRVGPTAKNVMKELEVAEKVRDLRRGQEAAGEV